MFGTGTRGFAVITAVIAAGTYAIVFWLLHATAVIAGFEGIRITLFRFKKTSESEGRRAGNNRQSTTSISTKAKEGENFLRNRGTRNKRISVDATASKQWLLPGFRRGKARVGDQEAAAA